MAYNQYDLNATSLVKTGNLTEMYIPLWYYSSGISGSLSGSRAGGYMMQKGATGLSSYNSASSQQKLHTLNSNWSANQKFAFEASFQESGGGTGYLELWDITSNTGVTGSQLSTTANSLTLFRSGQFTLTPGHVYGISAWSVTGSITITKASLIAFLS